MRTPDEQDPRITLGSFGHSLHMARLLAGMTATEAGKLAGFAGGEYWSLIERGERCPVLDKVPKIADAVKLNPAELCWLWVRMYAPSAWRAMKMQVD